MTIDRLDAMRTFVTIVDSGSFSAAAKRLGVSVPAISRRLSGFEERLGAPLLHRTTRNLACTEYGRMYYDRAARILSEVDDVETELAGLRHTPSGLLRVSAPSVFGRTFVAPLLPEFLSRYPRVKVDLSLVRGRASDAEADAAIQSGATAASAEDLGTRALGAYRQVLCAAPEYLRRAGKPVRPQDLAQHDCILESSSADGGAWRFLDDGQEVEQHVEGRLMCDDPEAALSAALAGSGVARLPSFQAREHVRANRLAVLLESYEPGPTPMNIAYAKRGPSFARASAFAHFLADHIPQAELGL